MPNKTQNILIIASWFDPTNKTPQGSFILEQAQMLQKRGKTVTIFYPHLKGTFFNTLHDRKSEFNKYKIGEISVFEFKCSPYLPKFRKFSYKKLSRLVLKKMEDIFPKDKPDIIHSHAFFMGGVIGNAIAAKFNIRWFHTEHSSSLIFNPKELTKLDRRLIRKLYLSSQKNFFVSEFFLEKICDQFSISKERCQVLHNIVSPPFFESKLQLPKKEIFTFINISRLTKVKGLLFLLSAWKEFVINEKNVKLIIVGKGEQQKRIIDFINSNSLQNSVELLPQLSRKEVITKISNSHVLASTSKIETFGLTVAEANALGKPVIATDSGGVRDIITKDTGILVARNIKDFVVALRQIKNEYTSFDADNIRSITALKFSEDVIFSQLEKAYKQK